MCGIAGFTRSASSTRDARQLIEGMCAAIAHRGPDDQGSRVFEGAALGMRRLSIIDVGGGMQPISNEDGTIQVVFNGEIYNHCELQRSLEALGHRFSTHCDTEVLVHLYEELGEGLVQRLDGMFAFAIWDSRTDRLLLARDRFGIKPLYYAERCGGIMFASELRSLLVAQRSTPAIDLTAIAWYLSLGYVPEPLSVFEGVRKLPPGHLLSWTPQRGLEIHRYWAPSMVAESSVMKECDVVDELRRRLIHAVHSHLESEVPLGAFLSGGLDSSTVVALMSASLGRDVNTFSIGFNEDSFNEAPEARAVARALGTTHRELIVTPDVDALVEDVIQCFDEPFADSSALPTLLVARLAREHVTVALSGDGGDELFGGYRRYAAGLARGELHPNLRQFCRTIAQYLPPATPGRNRLFDLARSRQGRYAASVALPLSVREGGIVREDIAVLAPMLNQLLAPHFAEAAGRDFAAQMMSVDIATYLPGDILTKVDRTSMAVSLEARVPLLDNQLAEFVLSLPSNMKVRGSVGKRIFRRAIADLVPPEVLERPKRGFALPLARWFRQELRYRIDSLLKPTARAASFVDLEALRRVAAEHRFGRRDHSVALWRVLVLETWLAALADGELFRPPRAARALDRIVERVVPISA